MVVFIPPPAGVLTSGEARLDGNVPRVTVEVLNAVSDEVVEAFARLTPQLSRSAPAPDRVVLERIVNSPATMLLGARWQGKIVGALTLVIFDIPTGRRAWIEDVVVDSELRGKGIGQELTAEAVRLAGEAGAKTVDLTSRPTREAAGRLYERVGFHLRSTRVYRYDLAKGG
jgi:ribosomal protein S18 acetylase RimI-like enzyme